MCGSPEAVAEDRKLRRVAAHVAHRLDEAVALVGRQVVLAHVVGQRVSLDAGGQGGSDDLPRVGAAVSLEIGSLDPVLQRPAQLERKRRATAPDDKAAQASRMQEWNAVDKSWDCPCHGSRFDYDGHVLQGPAQRELEVKRIEVAAANSASSSA